MAYRAAVHETTMKTPNFIMLGRELPMPSHLLVATQEKEEKKKSVHQYVQKLEKNLQMAYQWARKHLNRGQRYQHKQYDKRTQAGNVKKRNPCVVIQPHQLSDLLVKIETLDEKKEK